EAEDDAFVADLGANFVDGLVDVVAHVPFLAATADAVDEVADDFAPARRVRNFRMELNAVKMARTIFDRGEGRIVRDGDRRKAFWELRQFIAVGIPDLKFGWEIC